MNLKHLKNTAVLILLVSLALFLQIILQSFFISRTWIFFYPAIFIIAMLYGRAFGYISTVLSMLLAYQFLTIPDSERLLIPGSSFIEVLTFTLMGLVLAYFVDKFRKEKKANESQPELKRSKEFLDTLWDNLPLSVFLKDAANLRFVRVNKFCEDLFGLQKKDFIGNSDYNFFPKEQADFFTLKDREALAGTGVVDVPEERITNPVRGERILHTRKVSVKDANGNPLFLLGVSEDITEKKRIEEEQIKLNRELAVLKERESLAKREQFLAQASTTLSQNLDYEETLSRLAQLCVQVVGDWCTITMRTESGHFLRAAGAHKDPDKAQVIKEFQQVYPMDNRAIAAISAFEGEKPIILEDIENKLRNNPSFNETFLNILQKLGTKSCIIVPIRNRDNVLGSITFCAGPTYRAFGNQDLALCAQIAQRAGIAIENSLLYAAAKSAIKARDEFLSIASHELKTPITSLKLQIQMLMREIEVEKGKVPTPERFMKSIEKSNQQIDRLVSLINDLLDVSKMKQGKMSYQLKNNNLSELVYEVIDRFKEQAQTAGSEIKTYIQPNIKAQIDNYRMDQVITNLLTNAIKYGKGSTITVTLKENLNSAILTVEDKGLGIAKDEQWKIFKRFERAEPNANISGMGLGLYIAKQIIDAHHGTISVESEKNKGSLFTVSIPLHNVTVVDDFQNELPA